MMYVDESTNSKIIASFRCGNSGLGNRDNSMQEYGPNIDGRIRVCQLCHVGYNDEVHVIVDCPLLMDIRLKHKIDKVSTHVYLSNQLGASRNKFRTLMNKVIGEKEHLLKIGDFLEDMKLTYISRWLDTYST